MAYDPASSSESRSAAISDEQLALAYRHGDESALEAIIDRYRDDLFQFLYRFLRQHAAAEDVFQETFIQLHEAIDAFDAGRRLRPWLFTIAANKARDYLRRNRRHHGVSLSMTRGDGNEPTGPRIADLLEANLPLPPESADRAEVAEMVRKVVDDLPDHLREVIVLAYFQQFAYKEIAQVVQVPLGTVKSRLHAAVAAFADLWRTRYEGMGA